MRKGKKITGGIYHKQKKKKHSDLVRQARYTKLGETKQKLLRGRGGKYKPVLLSTNIANIISAGKAKKVKIKTVVETPSNRFWARQNILTKGAIIDTELGKARITNRPSQEGNVQAVLIEEKEK